MEANATVTGHSNRMLGGTRGRTQRKGMDRLHIQGAIILVLLLMLCIALLPLAVTFLRSIKTNFEISQGVWVLPANPVWSNWVVGFQGMMRNLFNSIAVSSIVTVMTILISSISSYVFARHEFPGKNAIFLIILTLLMIPGVLTLTPSFVLMMNLGLRNSWWALILPTTSGLQVGSILLLRTFMSQQPVELYEAVKIDGGGDWIQYTQIAVPLAILAIAIQAVGIFSAIYNDFLWPMLVIDDDRRQMLMPIIRNFTQQIMGVFPNIGAVDAIFLLSGVPLIITTFMSLKYFINGDFASGMKL